MFKHFIDYKYSEMVYTLI